MSQPLYSPGPWYVGYSARQVMASDSRGSFPICDIRGWGHFTGHGHGALGLKSEEAIAIQEANARLIAAAPDLLASRSVGIVRRAMKPMRREISRHRYRQAGSWCRLSRLRR